MKKLVAVLLSFAMILAMSTVAFADGATSPSTITTVEAPGNSVNIDVVAEVKAGNTAEVIGAPTYDVVVTWEYDGYISGEKDIRTVYLWNSETFKYDIVDQENSYKGFVYDEDEDWNEFSQTKVAITVKNKSDAKVTAAFSYVPVTDSNSNACSMIWDGCDNLTENFNRNNAEYPLDSIFGIGLQDRNIDAFEKYVFTLYAEDFYSIANDAYVAGEFNQYDIDGLIAWLKSGDCDYSEEFSSLNPEDASDLLRIYADEARTLSSDNTNMDVINSSLRIAVWVDPVVKLTAEGEKYLVSQDAGSVKVGHFTVTITPYTNGEN